MSAIDIKDATEEEKRQVILFFLNRLLKESEGYVELDEVDEYMLLKKNIASVRKITVNKSGFTKELFHVLSISFETIEVSEISNLEPLEFTPTGEEEDNVVLFSFLFELRNGKLHDVTEDDCIPLSKRKLINK